MTTSTLVEFPDTKKSNAPAYELVDHNPASDEADDLVAALIARERLDAGHEDAISLEDSMRSFGLDPGQYGLE